jgi:hypothetical protein
MDTGVRRRYRELLPWIKDLGDWSATKSNGGHIRFVHEASGAVVFTSFTTGDRARQCRNFRQDAKRAIREATQRRCP